MILAFISAGVVLFNHQQWKRLSTERDYIIGAIDPSIMLIQQIVLEVERTHTYLGSPDFNSEDFRATAWNDVILPLKDSAESYSKIWGEQKDFKLAFRWFTDEVDYLMEQQSAIVTNDLDIPAPSDFHEDLRFAFQTLMDRFLAYKNSKASEGELLIRRMNRISWVSFFVAILLAATFGSIIITRILHKIRLLKYHIREIANGQLPEDIPSSRDELNTIIRSLSELVGNLRQITEFAGQVGKGNFESDISVFNGEGSLGASLADMRQSLLNVAEENKKRRWFNEGIAQFSDILRTHNKDLDVLCDHVVRHLVHYLEATQGGIFIVNNTDPDDVTLEMRGLYAYDRKKFLNWTIRPGQGLAGQAYREREKIILKEIPQDYTEVSSGLGDATPSYLAIMPMMSNEEIYGVIEIASFRELEEHEIDFFEKVSENIGAAIASVKINQETTRLLEDSQLSTEQLRAQEEEMRQNAEELEATQEEIHRQMREASEQRDMFVSLIENVDGVIYRSKHDEVWSKVYLSENVEVVTGYHPSVFLEKNKSFGEIIHPDDLARVSQETEMALANKEKWNIEYRMIKRDGSLIWVEEKGKGVYDANDRITFIDGIIIDITERIEREQAERAASV